MSDKPFPWRTLLFVSVAFNLLVVGAVAGAYGAGVRVQRDAPEAAVTRMPGARAFIVAMPSEATRATMRRELADSWVESRIARRAASQARREAFDAAAAEPYDVERVRSAFARLREADQAAIGVIHDDVVEAFGRLTPAERRAAIDALRRARPARRAALAPAGEQVGEEAAPVRERWQERREEMRERRRERRERRQQQQ
jgi:uncharacterized membrane protein